MFFLIPGAPVTFDPSVLLSTDYQIIIFMLISLRGDMNTVLMSNLLNFLQIFSPNNLDTWPLIFHNR